jgi:CO/xanthine dehydrogenase FAD-binding subunit
LTSSYRLSIIDKKVKEKEIREDAMLQTVLTPTSLGDLRKALKQAPKATLMAGGTLVMPIINEGAHGISTLVSLGKLGLDGVSFKKGVATVGAAAPIAELARHSELRFLSAAIESIASPTLRNMATVGGNLFAEQPYGDLAVCLVALDATVTIVNAKNKRSASVEEVIKKGVKAGELVTQISFAIPKPGTFKYAKAARRALNSASIVTVAAVIPQAKGVVADCRIALGGVAAKPVRVKSVEKLLNGKPFDDKTVTAAAAAATKDIAPFTDAYASAWYRARVTPVHICRALMGSV